MLSMFIAIEGMDGSGKSTLAKSLGTKLLETFPYHVIVTREPGGTPLGERLREILLHRGQTKIIARAEALLMCAARAELMDEVIIPALNEGNIVVTDRHVGSTLAYQGFGRGEPRTSLVMVSRYATDAITPDLTLLLDGEVEVCLSRMREAKGLQTAFDQESVDFHHRVRDGYLALASTNMWWRTIQVGDDPQVVLEKAVAYVLEACTKKSYLEPLLATN